MAASDRALQRELSAGVRELASSMVVDTEETVRVDPKRGSRLALSATLPRLSVSPGGEADLRVGEVLGEGGMGQVCLARQSALDRDVAVKTVVPGNQRPWIAKLLLQEGLITGRLEHPNIIPVHLMGLDEQERPVIVMKRVEGVPWCDLTDQDLAARSGDRVVGHLEVFLEVCNAVSFAHSRGYVHRDIKPANVMVGAFGEVYLLDWGISTEIGSDAFVHVGDGEQGMPLGTPVYMAPEMCCTGGIIDELTDVYLLGATLHRCLTGTYRHCGDELVEILMAAARSEPYPYRGEIPEELAAICNKATAWLPAKRYASAAEMGDAVRAYLRHKGSIDLTHEAEVLLDAMVTFLEAGGDQAEARRLFTECRFAFMQALKDWSENARAAQGLQRCLEVMARVELDRGQLEAAKALLGQMPTPNAALHQAWEQLSRRQQDEDEQVAGLRRMAHELDPTVSKKPRAVLAILLGLTTVGLVGSALSDRPLFALTHRGAFYSMTPFVILFVVLAAVFRRALFATALNRRIMLFVAIALVGTTLNRAMALVAQPPFPYMLGVDLFLIAILAALASGSVDRAFIGPAILWTLGFIGVVLMPQNPMLPYGISQAGGLVALAVGFYRRKGTAKP